MTEEETQLLCEAADALEFCEGAIVDHFASADGLDYEAAQRIAWMVSDVLVKLGRQSNLREASRKEAI